MSITATPRVNYLNNRDMLAEIHKSKCSYCTFTEPEYHRYDIILPSIDKINIRTIAEAKRNKAKRLGDADFAARKAAGEKLKIAECEVDWHKIPKSDLIFRVMTFEHIPLSDRKKNPKTVSEHHERLNFIPFQHFKFNEEGELICVGKSHWRGDMETGHFDKTKGQLTDTLARMILKICDRYSSRSNIRGYTYVDEMRGHAVLQLTQIALQFDESKSDNCFAYYSSSISNSVIRILNIEKRHQNIRDDILEMNGMEPSFTRSNEHSFENDLKRSDTAEL